MRVILFLSLVVILISCAHTPNSKTGNYTFVDAKEIGRSSNEDVVYQGGFSGLWFLQKTQDGEFEFLTNTDRGPNGEPIMITGVARNSRPFLLPNFNPKIYKIRTNSKNMTFKIVDEISLRDPDGKDLSGLSQWPVDKNKMADEVPVNLAGEKLAGAIHGIDPEGICVDALENFWMVEEYRPSLLKFDKTGKLLKRYIPKNSLPKEFLKGQNVIVEALPEFLKLRRQNRGFEGIGCKNGSVIAALQSPAGDRKDVSVIEFDPRTERVIAEFSYPLKHAGVDKIGDLAYDAANDQLYAIEQNGKVGAESFHWITKVKLSSQTLLPNLTLDLPKSGYDFEKIEGLALISDKHIAVINDNDFGIRGDFDLEKQRVPVMKKDTVLRIFDLKN